MAATRSQSLSFLTRSVTVKPMPLGSDTKKTVIFEAELIASVAAIILWRDRIVNSSLVAFVDNNSVRDVCMSGKARNANGPPAGHAPLGSRRPGRAEHLDSSSAQPFEPF